MGISSVSDQMGSSVFQVEPFSNSPVQLEVHHQSKSVLPLFSTQEHHGMRTMAGVLFGNGVRPLEVLSVREVHALVHRLVQMAWQEHGASNTFPIVLKKLIQRVIVRKILPERMPDESRCDYSGRPMLWTSSHREKVIDLLMTEWVGRPAPSRVGDGIFARLHRWRSSGYLGTVKKHLFVHHDSILQEVKAKRVLRSNRVLNVVRGGPGLGTLARL